MPSPSACFSTTFAPSLQPLQHSTCTSDAFRFNASNHTASVTHQIFTLLPPSSPSRNHSHRCSSNSTIFIHACTCETRASSNLLQQRRWQQPRHRRREDLKPALREHPPHLQSPSSRCQLHHRFCIRVHHYRNTQQQRKRLTICHHCEDGTTPFLHFTSPENGSSRRHCTFAAKV